MFSRFFNNAPVKWSVVLSSRINRISFFSTEIPFKRIGNTIPVPISSMSPGADFLISESYNVNSLAKDDEINNREDLINRYINFFLLNSEDRRGHVAKYLADVASNWDPLAQFKKVPRHPVSLLPLSKASLCELDQLPELISKLNKPCKLGIKRQDSYQNKLDSWGALTMPIKLPGDREIYLPENLQASSIICDIVKHAAAAVESLEVLLDKTDSFKFEYYWMYCTVHIELNILPGSAMREQMVHVDGMMGKNKNTGEVPLWPKQHVIFSNVLPTEYYHDCAWQPPTDKDNKPDYEKNWFKSMDDFCKREQKASPKKVKPNQMCLISPYLMHESPTNETQRPLSRFFIRIGFGNTHYNGPNYTVNKRLGEFRSLEDRAQNNRPKFN